MESESDFNKMLMLEHDRQVAEAIYVKNTTTQIGKKRVYLAYEAVNFLLSIRKSVNRPPTPNVAEYEEKEHTIQEMINIKLIQSGEKERLIDLLREKLIECGWKEEMKVHCRGYMASRGKNNATLDEIIGAITPKGRASVPDSIKAELLQRIHAFFVEEEDSFWRRKAEDF